MITLPIWLLVIIGIFGLPLLVGSLTLTIMCIQAIVVVVKDLVKELF